MQTWKIRTFSVEKIIEPILKAITNLTENRDPPKDWINNKEKRNDLLKKMKKALYNACRVGCLVGKESEDENVKREVVDTVSKLKSLGSSLEVAVNEFVNSGLTPEKQRAMRCTGKELLSMVTKLLILADMTDVGTILSNLNEVAEAIEAIKNSQTSEQIENNFQRNNDRMLRLNQALFQRQKDLNDPEAHDRLAQARCKLETSYKFLHAAKLVSCEIPDVAAALDNSDLIFKDVMSSIDDINMALTSKEKDPEQEDIPLNLMQALDDFINRVDINPLEFVEVRHRPTFEEQLESVVEGAACLADSKCTRENTRNLIVEECNNVRNKLQDLLTEYKKSLVQEQATKEVETAYSEMVEKTQNLKGQLTKAGIDHVSDAFTDKEVVTTLVDAACHGNERNVKNEIEHFLDHSQTLVLAANAVSMTSQNPNAVKMVNLAKDQLERLNSQLINSALSVAVKPENINAIRILDMYKKLWLARFEVLEDSVDEAVDVDKFLEVSESHIMNDLSFLIDAFNREDVEVMKQQFDATFNRCKRVCKVLKDEICEDKIGEDQKKILESYKKLTGTLKGNFKEQVSKSAQNLKIGVRKDARDTRLVDACWMVYDGVKDARAAVTSVPEFREPKVIDLKLQEVEKKQNFQVETQDVKIKREFDEEEKTKIQNTVEEFDEEKRAFEIEVSKFDCDSNEVIQLARKMCDVMNEMTKYTNGKGQLKTTNDVIDAARFIAKLGSRLNKLTNEIASSCPDVNVKSDLQAYIQRVSLYCHQLTMCARVETEVCMNSGKIVSGIEGAMSLLQASKNLMNTVVLLMKSSYTASTKSSNPNKDVSKIRWMIKVPDKKPLILREDL